jgi:Caspase domain/WD domain, G-beta repeat
MCLYLTKCFERILCVSSLLFLAACTMATPEIRLNAGGVEMTLKEDAPIGTYASLSSDSKHLMTIGSENVAKLWDLASGTQIGQIPAQANSPLVFTPDGKYALIGGQNLSLWDVYSGKKIRTIGEDEARVVAMSSDGNKVLTYHKSAIQQGYLEVYDIESGKKISEWRTRGVVRWAALSHDGKYALTPYMMGEIALWHVQTGRVVSAFSGHPDTFRGHSGFFSLALSPDDKYAASGGSDGTVKLYDVSSGEELLNIKAHPTLGAVTFVSFSPDGKYILSGGADGLVKLWDIHSGLNIKTYKVLSSGHFAVGVAYAALSADGQYMVSQSVDASIRIWNAKTGEEIAVLVGFKDGEWLAITSEGYYNASEKGAQNLYVNFEGKEYGVDQFYDVFYRPDIVLAKLRNEEIQGLVTITMQDAIKSPPPVVEITKLVETGAKANVCYQAKSAGGGIGEIRLFHNGKLIQSDGYYREMAKSSSGKGQLLAMDSKDIYENMRSVHIVGKENITPMKSKSKGNIFEDCMEVEAVPGENAVSVTAFNSGNSVQSSIKTIKFNSTVQYEDPHLYILSIGIDKYKDNEAGLKYAAKDATDIEEKLRQHSATVYKPQNIHFELLTDKNASKENIMKKIIDISHKTKPNDGFILFVAGHGVLIQNQYYMLTSDFDGSVNDLTMISSNEIVEMSKTIKSLSQLFIFDTCHAGGVDMIVSGLYDARMSVLAKKMGLHIYASASSVQEALDGYQGNGLFTYMLLDGLDNKKEADKNNDNAISVVELGDYAKQATVEISRKNGHSQTPLIINFGKDIPIYNLK